nr:uncharacterized mitochondrial protein AtMg00810-like [Tanacetum cinerariifolium]
VTPKTSHLHAVKRIFRYLKGQPKLGIWYPKESAFNLEAYSNTDYAGANLGRKSTTRGNFNKPDDIVDKGDDYIVNKGRSTDKIKVLNAEAKGVSVAGETLSTATLAVSTARSRMKRMSKRQKTDADLEEEEQLGVFLNIIPNKEREVDYAVLDKSSPCLTNIKNWLVQKQMALGKDFSNLLLADSLPKTIWFSTHHVS